MSDPLDPASPLAAARRAEVAPQIAEEALPPHEALQVSTVVHGRVLLALPAPAATGTAIEPTALLVGFHGYAERAEDALAAGLRLAAGQPWAVAAPQALHTFYRSKDGAIGGSWMTSQDRELRMAENVVYVNAAIANLRARLPSARRLAIFGFSQGVAMAYRSAAWCAAPVDAVVALAADVPPELRGARWAQRPAVLLGRGDGERWYTEEKLATDLEALAALGLEHEVCRFAGGHEWGAGFVARATEFLRAKLA
jgi:predicted esterase